jgi:hypothetical protein
MGRRRKKSVGSAVVELEEEQGLAERKGEALLGCRGSKQVEEAKLGEVDVASEACFSPLLVSASVPVCTSAHIATLSLS